MENFHSIRLPLGWDSEISGDGVLCARTDYIGLCNDHIEVFAEILPSGMIGLSDGGDFGTRGWRDLARAKKQALRDLLEMHPHFSQISDCGEIFRASAPPPLENLGKLVSDFARAVFAAHIAFEAFYCLDARKKLGEKGGEIFEARMAEIRARIKK